MTHSSPRPAGHRILVLGGARSGKSRWAEGRLRSAGRVDYVAPGPPESGDDLEWAERVRRHRARRPAHWATHETRDLVPLLTAETVVPVLIDCLTTWLSGVMDDCGVWEARPGSNQDLEKRIDSLVGAWASARRPAVAVSNEVGWGVVPATESGRRFRDELGGLNARVAAECAEVFLMIAGIPQRLR